MKRIALIASIAAAFAGVTAGPAGAGFEEDESCVRGPAADNAPGNGAENNNASSGGGAFARPQERRHGAGRGEFARNRGVQLPVRGHRRLT